MEADLTISLPIVVRIEQNSNNDILFLKQVNSNSSNE